MNSPGDMVDASGREVSLTWLAERELLGTGCWYAEAVRALSQWPALPPTPAGATDIEWLTRLGYGPVVIRHHSAPFYPDVA